MPAKWVAGYHPRHLHRFSAADCDMKPLTVPVSFGVVIFLPVSGIFPMIMTKIKIMLPISRTYKTNVVSGSPFNADMALWDLPLIDRPGVNF